MKYQLFLILDPPKSASSNLYQATTTQTTQVVLSKTFCCTTDYPELGLLFIWKVF